MTSRLSVEPRAASAVRRGHPWVFREGLTRVPKDLKSGAAVELDAGGERLGSGLFDAQSPIAVRVFVVGSGRLDTALIAARVEAALSLRDRLFGVVDASATTDAFRLVNGEGDRVPGLVIDRYRDVAIARTDGEAMAARWPELSSRLWGSLAAQGVKSLALRVEAGAGQRKLTHVAGEETPDTCVVRENGMQMRVDLARGQKTGAFLDQRDNRALVRARMRGGERVLNLFSYAGGFSVAAALGGAGEVTSVDSAAAAHATAQASFRLNGLDPATHRFVTADVRSFLDEAHRRGERFDVVISDPPSFAKNERSVKRALTAYRGLHHACVRVLAPRGLFFASSCSSHVDMSAFRSTLDDASLGRSDLRVIGAHGCPADHPTLPGFPEGEYLKLVELA
jgi:23S rRNA (cytosine1962-C5)-methyltransferase